MVRSSTLQLSVDGPSPFPLSGEIVIEILRHTFPSDIIRKACRFFYDVTNTRIVWLNALERMCNRHGVFKPTFPSQIMSMLELEYASLGPRRFLNMLNSTPSDECPMPYDNREVIFRRRPPLSGAHPCDGCYLATGGRFLLAHGEDDSVSLWDLGYSIYAPIGAYPIATLESSGELAAVSQSTDGEGIIIVTRQRTTSLEMDSLTVYEIRPAQDCLDSTFVKLAQLGIDQSTTLHNVRIKPHAVVVRCGPQFFVWDWSSNRGSKWISSTLFKPPVRAMSVLERTILAHDEDGTVYNWDIPTLPPLPTGISDLAHLPSVENEPKSFFHPSALRSDVSVHIRCTASHQRNSEALDSALCIVCDDDPWAVSPEGRSPLSLYSVREMWRRREEDPFIPNTLFTPSGSCGHVFGSLPECFYGSMTSLYRCEDSLVFCADTDDAGLIATVLPVPTKATLSNLSSVALTRRLLPAGSLHAELDTSVHPGFCPISGRLVYLAADGSVYLCDFLKSAPESSGRRPGGTRHVYDKEQ